MTWQIDVQGRRGGFAYHFAFEAGPEPLAVIGPNGAGKTTLVRALIGAIRPTAGHIRLGGRPLFEAGGPWVPPEARRLGYVPQGYGLFPHLTAAQNVAFGIDGDLPRARALLAELGIAHAADRRPTSLSGGERQRVALARALAIEPDALLLDEPLAALDVAARRETRQFLTAHLRATRRPTVVITHDLRDVRALGGPVLVIEGGRVIQSGDLAALRAAPATAFVAEFVDAAPTTRGS